MKEFLLLATFLPMLSGAVDTPILPANIEINIIFPRNETYSPADKFPIVLALQNAPLAYDFGFHLLWELRNLSIRGSSSDFIDSESILRSNLPIRVPAPSKTLFIVNSTDEFTSLYQEGIGTYQLTWYFALGQNCTRDGDFINHSIGARLAEGGLVFTIADGGKPANLTAGGPCPPAGAAFRIQSNITGCAHVDDSGVQAKPCNIVINDQLASSISAQLPLVTISTTSAPILTTPGSTTSTSSSTDLPSSTSTSVTGNNAPRGGPFQTAAALLAGAAGLCIFLV
ncbi:hypothetical protein H072_4346 [Dactylellina haptotyla CBS 200.50]|uniref:DUF7136 domain-containing protein n=1 Tax=Dactylellina haptotyla (strain CBS 200.50) TaxID=1284197 RepID=S8BQN3_DACHA|nr:hypothetical protein H072_4346 [Dactylellina haptotyla CBS 200.50]